MHLDRNNGKGKYAIINLRKLQAVIDAGTHQRSTEDAISILEDYGLIEYGAPGTEDEFFVIKLRDRFAHKALGAYATEAFRSTVAGMRDYAHDVAALAKRAGKFSAWVKDPD